VRQVPPSHVLIVEDDPSVRALLAVFFAAEGYEVRAVENGRPALALLEDWHPHVIILDLMMPDVDGWTFRARQLAHEEWADIPVIVMSAGLGPRSRLDNLQPAAVFAKPFDTDDLLSTVQSLAS
jgi:CheY-like chemotaxis protein